MKLHLDGVLPPGYWGNEIPKGYKSDWISFTCMLDEEEVILLKSNLNRLLLPYWFRRMVNPYWCLSMPESSAMQFRLHFPCPSSCSGAMKDFAEFEL